MQALSCGGSLSHVVDSSTPLRCGRNDIRGDVFCFFGGTFRPFGAERHTGRSLRFCWGTLLLPVVPTMSNVVLSAMGNTPPEEAIRCSSARWPCISELPPPIGFAGIHPEQQGYLPYHLPRSTNLVKVGEMLGIMEGLPPFLQNGTPKNHKPPYAALRPHKGESGWNRFRRLSAEGKLPRGPQ